MSNSAATRCVDGAVAKTRPLVVPGGASFTIRSAYKFRGADLRVFTQSVCAAT